MESLEAEYGRVQEEYDAAAKRFGEDPTKIPSGEFFSLVSVMPVLCTVYIGDTVQQSVNRRLRAVPCRARVLAGGGGGGGNAGVKIWRRFYLASLARHSCQAMDDFRVIRLLLLCCCCCWYSFLFFSPTDFVFLLQSHYVV